MDGLPGGGPAHGSGSGAKAAGGGGSGNAGGGGEEALTKQQLEDTMKQILGMQVRLCFALVPVLGPLCARGGGGADVPAKQKHRDIMKQLLQEEQGQVLKLSVGGECCAMAAMGQLLGAKSRRATWRSCRLAQQAA